MRRRNQTRAGQIFDIFNHFFLVILAVACILPMLHLLALSFSSKDAIMAGKVGILPVGWQVDSYITIMKTKAFLDATLIAFVRTILGLVINMLLIVLAAYPLSKEESAFKARPFYVWFFLLSMLFNGGIIPTYMVVSYTGLIDSIWALVLPGAVPVFSVILLQNYFKSIPQELCEAAQIDGASHWRILFKVYLPLSKPVLSVLVLFSAFNHWNSWFDGMLYINTISKYPLQTYLRTIVVKIDPARVSNLRDLENICAENTNAAQIVLAMIPILMIYPFLQKHFAKGIMLGSVKG